MVHLADVETYPTSCLILCDTIKLAFGFCIKAKGNLEQVLSLRL